MLSRLCSVSGGAEPVAGGAQLAAVPQLGLGLAQYRRVAVGAGWRAGRLVPPRRPATPRDGPSAQRRQQVVRLARQQRVGHLPADGGLQVSVS